MFDEDADLMHRYHHFFQLMKEVKKRLVVERDMETVGKITGDSGKELDMMTITKVEVMTRAGIIRAGMTKEGMTRAVFTWGVIFRVGLIRAVLTWVVTTRAGMIRVAMMVVMTMVAGLMMVVLMAGLMMVALMGVTLVEIFKQTLASMTYKRSDILFGDVLFTKPVSPLVFFMQ